MSWKFYHNKKNMDGDISTHMSLPATSSYECNLWVPEGEKHRTKS